MRMGVACIVSMVAISVAVTVPASADTVRLAVGQRLQRFSDLTPGAHRYMRYLVNKDGSRQLVDIWDRRVSFGLKPNGSGPGMRITQRWDRADKSSVLIQDGWFDPGTFRPLTHIRDTEKNGRKTVWGFEFTDSAVVIRVRLKTLPLKQWPVGREFNRRMKKAFDRHGIEMPAANQTHYLPAEGDPMGAAATKGPEPVTASN